MLLHILSINYNSDCNNKYCLAEVKFIERRPATGVFFITLTMFTHNLINPSFLCLQKIEMDSKIEKVFKMMYDTMKEKIKEELEKEDQGKLFKMIFRSINCI